jgi:SAM-dependent methyltransferase
VRGVDALAYEGFSRAASSYERGRPGYPEAAVAWICAELGLCEGCRVVDLGAGTGKLGVLVREIAGAEVIAVEPVRTMREIAAAHGLAVLDATAESLPIEPRSVDAVLCGEAFHWFDGGRALAKLARVVRPGGGLGLIWNVHAWDRGATWVKALERLLGPYSDRRAQTRYGSGRWRAAFAPDGPWSALEERSFSHRLLLAADELVAHLDSVAFVAALPDRERAQLLSQVAAVGTALEEVVAIPYRTDAYVSHCRGARAIGGPPRRRRSVAARRR